MAKNKTEALPKHHADEGDFAPFGLEMRDKISALEDMINADNFSTSLPVPTNVDSISKTTAG